jgi:uncharacterized membrane protein
MERVSLAAGFGVVTSFCALAATHLSNMPKKTAIVTGCVAFVSMYAVFFFEEKIKSFAQNELEIPTFIGAYLIAGSLVSGFSNKLFVNPNISWISSTLLFTGSSISAIPLAMCITKIGNSSYKIYRLLTLNESKST